VVDKVLIASALVAVMIPIGLARQQLPRPSGDAQPGRTWSQEQLEQFAGAVRAGRTLTPKIWPNSARIAVAFTFTVNNAANNFARGDATVDLIAGGEFGALRGLPRVLDLLDRYDVPATFFVAATAGIVDPQMIPDIVKRKRHEIGMLGWSDENPLQINDAVQEEQLLMRAADNLAKAAGKTPIGARGPSMALSLHTLGILKKSGFLYDSTLMAMDQPYEVLLDGQPSGIVELPVSRMLDDLSMLSAPRFGPSALPSPRLAFETYRDDFDQAYAEGTMFLLTLHPQFVGMRSRIDYLENLIVYMKSTPGVWFATAQEIARYVKPA
jgi:peptidoglycan/xylan/chitin deacetylase (PgdA/CDA1 family)